jgi:hypothetical protein
MRSLVCQAGKTQLGKVLAHVKREHDKAPVAALVFVGDAFEELLDEVIPAARVLKVPTFLFEEGRNPEAEQAFREIARCTGGAHCQFGVGSGKQLGALLRAVAAFAAGGRAALEGRKDEASALLLGQLQ